jgi:hypothetical protein
MFLGLFIIWITFSSSPFAVRSQRLRNYQRMSQTLWWADGAKIVVVLPTNLKTDNQADGIITLYGDREALKFE